MDRNLFWDMEKITICIGVTIICLGFWNITGYAIISPALVTGISASGLCITIADFISKKYNNPGNKWVTIIDNCLYFLAALCLLGYPNVKVISSLDKDILDSISTTASLVALGVVFVTIGFSNKVAILEREKKNLEEEQKRMQKIFEHNQKLSQMEDEQHEKIMKSLKNMSKDFKDLEKRVNELKDHADKGSV
ncbi:hypothetical protein [Bacillus thuringiensis]|uniref:hypothetical protein n=1 Tax=Bacillus thuringiensis TaxID=1428 RepID=UPI000BF2D61E|nr:hypothetical protein [Bacillus thuringiensis]MED4447378.1 hypothetical protein [Bacillus cereus]PFL05105.1 hypothetical protein COJ28_23275 [Bacillus thuringiensis]